jgi:hypothetical protein
MKTKTLAKLIIGLTIIVFIVIGAIIIKVLNDPTSVGVFFGKILEGFNSTIK